MSVSIWFYLITIRPFLALLHVQKNQSVCPCLYDHSCNCCYPTHASGTTPLLYIGRESWPDPLNYQKLEKLLSNTPQQASVLMPGTEHFDFSDAPLFSPYMQTAGLAGTIPANELAADLEDRIVRFFNLHLKSQ